MANLFGNRPRMAHAFTEAPYGVIDIGSNSVRLVIFEGLTRAPNVIFNEKVGCELGREVAEGRPLDPERVAEALGVLARFAVITRYYGVSDLDAVATAAVRDSDETSRTHFLESARKALGCPIRILSEDEEAFHAAAGVVSGMPWANGVVGDLGGGSLELVRVSGGQIHETVSLPLGVLRLQPGAHSDDKEVAARVSAELARVPWLTEMAGNPFYAVGGNWRNFARAHMAYRDYPLPILHGYGMSAKDVSTLTRAIRKREIDAVEAVESLKKRRQDYLRPAAIALDLTVQTMGADKVVISGHGVREGLVFKHLNATERARDPLIEGAYAMARRMARTVIDVAHVEEWIAPVFDDPKRPLGEAALDPEERQARLRLRRAATILADVGWGFHSDTRASRTADLIMTSSLSGVDHPGRAFLGLALWYRYTRIDDYEGLLKDVMDGGRPSVSAGRIDDARALGHALHLAYELTGGAPNLLQHARLDISGDRLSLILSGPTRPLASYDVEKRLRQLAQIIGLNDHKLAIA